MQLSALFAPLSTALFFTSYYEKAPLHLSSAGSERPIVLTHEELFRALSAQGDAPDGLVCFPEHIGTTARELFSSPEALRRYIDSGHPLVWNRAHGIAPGIDAVTALLTRTFGAHVWPNVYATGTAGTPFDMHFDTHEVVALACEGEKTWQISEVRVDRPLCAKEMEPAIEAALRARRDEAIQRTKMTFTARPGDLIYIPRGQFHNASARSGRSLHVTFGIELLSGFDLARLLVTDLLADPTMREMLPPRAADPDGARTADMLLTIAERLREATCEGALLDAFARAQKRYERGPGPPP